MNSSPCVIQQAKTPESVNLGKKQDHYQHLIGASDPGDMALPGCVFCQQDCARAERSNFSVARFDFSLAS